MWFESKRFSLCQLAGVHTVNISQLCRQVPETEQGTGEPKRFGFASQHISISGS